MEFNVLKCSEVKSDNVSFRIDAEFFRKAYLQIVRQVEKKQISYVDAICSWVTQGPNPVFSTAGIPCLTGRNINHGEVSYVDTDHVDEEEYLGLSRYQLQVGDTLITLKGKGSIGKVGFVTNDRKAIFSRDIGIIRPVNINPGYLNVFFLCKYGKQLVDRGETGGTGQSTLTTSYLKAIPVPRFGELEELIGSILNKVEILKKNNSDKYRDAESFLLSELSLSNWQPVHQLSFIKNYSEADKAGRIDADYFQPKYDEIVKAIKSYPGGWDTLGNIVSVKKSIEVGSDAYMDEGDVPFVRVSNLSPFEITEEKYISNELYAELSQHQPKQGEILLSKDGTPGIAYHINEKSKKMIPSGGILRLQLKNKKINEDYLTLVLNSMIVQEQINRDVGGSIILHWRPEQVKETLIPILPEDKQFQIQQNVTESFNLRKQSKHLLECAERAVEIAIEENEDEAIKWLKEQTKGVG